MWTIVYRLHKDNEKYSSLSNGDVPDNLCYYKSDKSITPSCVKYKKEDEIRTQSTGFVSDFIQRQERY